MVCVCSGRRTRTPARTASTICRADKRWLCAESGTAVRLSIARGVSRESRLPAHYGPNGHTRVLAHSRLYKNIQTCAHTHTHTHTCARPHTHSLSLALSLSRHLHQKHLQVTDKRTVAKKPVRSSRPCFLGNVIAVFVFCCLRRWWWWCSIRESDGWLGEGARGGEGGGEREKESRRATIKPWHNSNWKPDAKE